MKNDLKRAAKREARVWAVAVVVLGVWMAAVWIGYRMETHRDEPLGQV